MPAHRVRNVLAALAIAILWTSSAFPASDWEAVGPYGGHAENIVVAENDPNRLYVTTRNGQIYRSLNAGNRWDSLPFHLASGASLETIALDPVNPLDLYVGVRHDSIPEVESGEGGIYKSEDGGLHWRLLPATKGWAVLSLAINSDHPETVVAGAADGVFQSNDAGNSWKRISPLNHPEIKSVVSLALVPSDAMVVYAGTPHLPWKTLDGGANWQLVDNGMLEDSDIFSIAVDPANPQSLVVGACSGIYRTISGGSRWIGIFTIPETNRRTYHVVQDPVSPNIFYAGTTQGLWKSRDGGVTWTKANPYPYVINSVAIGSGVPQALYLATDRSGILKSLDGGKTLEAVNTGFVNRNLTKLISTEDGLFLSSAYDGDFGGIFTSSDKGVTWQLSASRNSLLGRNIVSLSVAPESSRRFLAGSYSGLLKSDDGGRTWQDVSGQAGAGSASTALSAAMGRVYEVEFSRAERNMLYAATDHGLFESSDGGSTWWKNPSAEVDAPVYKLALHPGDAQSLIVQTSRGLLISHDGGLVWNPLNVSSRQDAAVYDFSFSRVAPYRVIAATSQGLLQSDDGVTWSRALGGLPGIPVHQIFFSRTNDIYVLSREGNHICRSTSAGTTWTCLNNRGLDGLSVLSIVDDPNDDTGRLFVVTENRGVFVLNAPSIATSFPER